MTIEFAPIHNRDYFTIQLRKLTNATNEEQVKSSRVSLRKHELGFVYDPRPTSGRMMLILQEKERQTDSGIARRTIRIELFANRFKLTSYLTGFDIEKEVEKQIEDIEEQNIPLELDDDEYTFEGLETLIFRSSEPDLSLDQKEKPATPKDLIDIHRGLALLTCQMASNRNASRIFTQLFNRQFEIIKPDLS